MFAELSQRVEELRRRAGLGRAPAPVVVAVLLVAAVALAYAGWRWWPRDAVGGDTLTQRHAAASAPARGSDVPVAVSVPASSPATVCVYVVGEVRHPGVYVLPDGSRIEAAVNAAGGMTEKAALTAVNLAAKLVDGDQVLIPNEHDVKAGEAPASSAGGGARAGAAAPASGAGAGAPAVVNINTADAAALDSLPGVGPSTAAKIVADRQANGPFASPDELGRVPGIGPKKLEQLKPMIRVR